MEKLSTKQINTELKMLPGWEYHNQSIHKQLSFSTYLEGIDFVQKLAVKAEELNHHPDLIIGWCKVNVTFTTHDSGGVTENDINMAREAEKMIND